MAISGDPNNQSMRLEQLIRDSTSTVNQVFEFATPQRRDFATVTQQRLNPTFIISLHCITLPR